MCFQLEIGEPEIDRHGVSRMRGLTALGQAFPPALGPDPNLMFISDHPRCLRLAVGEERIHQATQVIGLQHGPGRGAL